MFAAKLQMTVVVVDLLIYLRDWKIGVEETTLFSLLQQMLKIMNQRSCEILFLILTSGPCIDIVVVKFNKDIEQLVWKKLPSFLHQDKLDN